MTLLLGDCSKILKSIDDDSIDLIYMDPPFFSQKNHKLQSRQDNIGYSFEDKWDNIDDYLTLMSIVLKESRRLLKNTGSIFLHCDKYASHYLRCKLDEIFGMENFQSEIIWNYKRWSNSKKGLLNNHQNIYFYSKTNDFYFKTLMCDYSPSTNIDQILQLRERDALGKTKYKLDKNGRPVLTKEKKGVPLSDVWDIPFLNPKAKERTGYPTQKPVLLLERILEIASPENATVLDPFCGSGTTLLAAKRMRRKYIGIDISQDAIDLSKKRLEENVVSKSKLLNIGRNSYINKNDRELSILNSISAIPVQRNKGIDGFINGLTTQPIPVKIQKNNESITCAAELLLKATRNNDFDNLILIRTNYIENIGLFPEEKLPKNIHIIDSADLVIQNLVS